MKRGFSLIGLIIAVVILGLLGAGVLLMTSSGTLESLQAVNKAQAFCAAESGISAARYYMRVNPGWETNAPSTITGMAGNASFSAVLLTNVQVTSVGRLGNAQWTSIWTGSVGSATGQIVASYEDGNTVGNLADFPGDEGDCGQSFTTPDHAVMCAVIALGLKRDNPAVSPIYVTLRSGSMIGPVLGTSAVLQGSDLPYGQADWVFFPLDVPVSLQPDTTYFIRVSSIPPSTDPDSAAIGQIHWQYRKTVSDPPGYAGGDAWIYIGAGADPDNIGECQNDGKFTHDMNFRIYN